MTERRGGALEGIRVIDLTQMLAGPYCTQMLADQGADVIKIEPPQGDSSRKLGPYRADDQTRRIGGYFASVNRNKKSIVIDLKSGGRPRAAAAPGAHRRCRGRELSRPRHGPPRPVL